MTTKSTRKSVAQKSTADLEAWGERMADTVETDEWVDKLAHDVDTGRVVPVTDPAEIQRLLRGPGRPPLGPGPGSSAQVRARLDGELLEALDAYVRRFDTSRSMVVREALRQFLDEADREPVAT